MTIVTSYISGVVGEGTKNKLILPNSNPPFMQQTLLYLVMPKMRMRDTTSIYILTEVFIKSQKLS